MKIHDIKILTQPLVLANPAEVDAIESSLWINFPAGYREYVTHLGEGVLGGHFVRIYPPWRITKELVDWRRRIGKYWFWEKSREMLPKDRAVECVIIGDTLDGDELIFHPARPRQLFVLPRGGSEAHVAGSTLLEAVEWMCNSGKLTEPFSERNFAPFDSRNEVPDVTSRKVVDPNGETLDEIVSAAIRWSKRRKARDSAKNAVLDAAGKNGKETTSVLLYEAFVLERKYPYNPGYLAVFQVNDKSHGLEVGSFWWALDENSASYSYVPNSANIEKLKKGNDA